MQFDYILTNPPFTIGTNKMIYVAIIESQIKRCKKQIYWIGPTGAGASKIYKKYKSQITKIERLNNKEFPVMTDCVTGLIDLQLPHSLQRDITYTTSTKSERTNKAKESFVWTIKAKDYPDKVPNVRMSQSQYNKYFDPKGQKWETYDINTRSDIQEGIVRFSTAGLRAKAKNYVYTKDIRQHIIDLPEVQGKRYHMLPFMPGGTRELAKVLGEMDKSGKISGKFMQERLVSIAEDLDPIRRDLL